MDAVLGVDPQILIQWGQMVFQGVLVLVLLAAFVDAFRLAKDRFQRHTFLSNVKQALPWAAGLVAAQLAAIAMAVIDTDFKMLGIMAIFYLLIALVLPLLWATGQHWGGSAGMPIMATKWSERRKLRTTAAIAIIGVTLNVLLFSLVDVSVGESLSELKARTSSVAFAVLATWLIFNAPWMEEILLRHYLLARIASTSPGNHASPSLTRVLVAIVLVAILFALGHLVHMQPMWPKLLQTFVWGLMLGWARVWLGTWHAIWLHLAWNVTAPLVAVLISK